MTEHQKRLKELQEMAEQYDGVSLDDLRQAHAAVAAKAVDDDRYLPLFEKLDEHVDRMETLEKSLSPIERARLKLKMRKG